MRRARFMALFASLAVFTACATGASPFDDVLSLQRRLDERGLGFGLTRVPGHDAMLFQIRFSGAEAADPNAPPPDIQAAADAAAPMGCRVETISPAVDGVSFRVDYLC